MPRLGSNEVVDICLGYFILGYLSVTRKDCYRKTGFTQPKNSASLKDTKPAHLCRLLENIFFIVKHTMCKIIELCEACHQNNFINEKCLFFHSIA